MKKIISIFIVLAVMLNISVLPITCTATSSNNTDNEKNTVIEINSKDLCAENASKLISDKEKKISDAVLVENGSVQFNFSVEEEGNYRTLITYFSGYDNKIGNYEIGIQIDGEYKLDEIESLSIPRVWTDDSEIEYDFSGNQMLPDAKMFSGWRTIELKNPNRYLNNALTFDISSGVHTVTVESKNGAFVIDKITLIKLKEPVTYKEYIKKHKENGAKNIKKSVKVEAEAASAKSQRFITPISDKTSPNTSPYHSYLMRYNTIGGDKWKNTGDWLEWKIPVSESGLYTISLRWKQDIKESDISSRAIYIDDELPFKEAAAVEFSYDTSWQVSRLGNEEGYQFYLDEGEHTLRLEAVMGKNADIINEVGTLIDEMNDIYLDVVMVTGPSPDSQRDYGFDKTIPDTIKKMKQISQRLHEIEEIINKSSGIGSMSAAFKMTYRQLDDMTKNPSNIAIDLVPFKDAISSLSNWQTTAMTQPLQIDWIELTPATEKLPNAEAGFFKRLWHHVKQLVMSYVADYDSVGQKENKAKDNITVWLGGSGSDQAQIIRQLNYGFTEKSGTGVSFRLVNAGALLSATLADIGPDVAIAQAQTEPVNFALRGAVEDLSKMEGFSETEKWFDESALTPFRFNGGIYALPETQTFPMLFVRTDIMEKLNISLQSLSTWEDIFEGVLAKIQNNYLEFGISSAMDGFSMFLFQNGGSYYADDSTYSTLNNVEGVSAFTMFSELFTDYKQPLAFDFSNRFRSGEMPIAITDISAYNQLSVFAPEIKGKWLMLPVPGTKTDDGIINRTIATNVTGAVLFSQSENKQKAWEYIKWWCSANTQSEYASSLEALLGTSGRYYSANRATTNLDWDHITQQSISEQQEWLRTVPEIAGGYYTSRHFSFAFRQVVYNDRDAREALNDAVKSINSEIANKRKEFGLN